MSDDLNVALRLYLEANGLNVGITGAGRIWRSTTQGMERDTLRLGNVLAGLRNQLAGLGLGVGLLGNQRLSAALDEDLTRIRQTAGGTAKQMRDLRGDLFAMATETGRPLETLKGGFNNLIQSGLEWKQSLAAIRAINPASAVTGASEDILAGALTVAASSYNFNLAEPGRAAGMLDQMTVAGRAGNAELEDLAGIFARVGVNAKNANLQFADTLGFVESLSQVERQPERLATLADSTLRLFNNVNYQKRATTTTGVKFYDKDGAARDPVDVLQDIAKKYRTLKTDEQRAKYIYGAFGQADLDTQKGLRTLLGTDALDNWRAISAQIKNAGGTIARDLPDALDNAAEQARRLKTIMREVGDDFAKPINRAFASLLEWQLKPRDQGGAGLGTYGTAAASVAEVAALAGGAYLAKGIATKVGGKLIGSLFGGAASTAAGIAQGKVAENLAGVAPVFVTNWPAGASQLSDAAGSVLGGAAAGGVATATVAAISWPVVATAAVAALGAYGVFKATRWVQNATGWDPDEETIRSRPGVQLTDDAKKRLADPLTAERLRVRDALKSQWTADVDAQVIQRWQRSHSDAVTPFYLRRAEDQRVPALLSRPSAPPEPMSATLRVVIEQNGRVRVAGFDSSPNFNMQINTGALLPHIGG